MPNSTRRRMERFKRFWNYCDYCGSKRDLTIDHIKARSHGGHNEPSNWQTLCLDCNRLKGRWECFSPETTVPPQLKKLGRVYRGKPLKVMSQEHLCLILHHLMSKLNNPAVDVTKFNHEDMWNRDQIVHQVHAVMAELNRRHVYNW